MSVIETHAHPDRSDTDWHGEGTELDHEAHGDHGDPSAHGSVDDHGHGTPAEPLGPVDVRAWAAAIGGAALGIVVILALYLSISG
jgi:hypothetical protein